MHRPSIGFICASYEVNRSNSQGADITKTSNNPYDVDHRPFDLEMVLMTCFWATYQSVKLAGRHRVDMAKTSNGPVWLAPLTLWNGNGVWHIRTSWVVFVPHIKQICQIDSKPQNRHDKNLEQHVTLYFEQPVWSWSSAFWPGNGVWHIIISWVIFVQNMKGISQIGTEPWSRHDKNFEQSVWPLTFQPDVLCKFHENPMIGTCQKKLWRTDGHTCRQIKPFIIELAACCNWKYLNWKWPIRIVFQFYPYTYFW